MSAEAPKKTDTGPQAKEAGQRYTVVFKPDTPDEVIEKSMEDVKKQGGTIHHKFDLMKGYAANLPTSFHAELKGHDQISFIEEDQEMRIQ
ncbi:hypothetical protein IWQ60_002525 [Tieghemiomyces parasiticus]|uniref:Inhibitor I9 domain-containing protein n=1 Tax=Tieghemiomyces parasiticus TaxID=78921 RepID=A0A9W8AF05_9FUNG|nr:hypothetical protein IWQ60_002525 [Tieghemiomyces parasiticus]